MQATKLEVQCLSLLFSRPGPLRGHGPQKENAMRLLCWLSLFCRVVAETVPRHERVAAAQKASSCHR